MARTTEKKQPAMMFYTGDWLKDPQLSMCSAQTRGIWFDLLCAMHESDRSGQIAGTPEQLARICRCTTVEFDAAVNELKSTNTADVTFRHKIVTVINRRMHALSRERKANNDRQRRRRMKNVTPLKHEKKENVTTPLSYSYSISSTIPPPSPPGGDDTHIPPGDPPPDLILAEIPDGRNPPRSVQLCLPPELDTPAFRSAWAEWEQHRREIKKKLTPLSVKLAINQLASLGEKAAIEAIRHSIANGWTGIHPPDERRGNANGPKKIYNDTETEWS